MPKQSFMGVLYTAAGHGAFRDTSCSLHTWQTVTWVVAGDSFRTARQRGAALETAFPHSRQTSRP
jgi:hypothetical protein